MKRIIILITVMLFSTLNLAAQSKNDQARAYYIEAEKNYGLENYQAALNNLNKVEDILGNTNARVVALKVKSYFEIGDYSNAKNSLNKFTNYNSSEALKNEVLSYIVKIDTKLEQAEIDAKRKLEQAKIDAKRKREEDEKNWLKAKTIHTIESYNIYLDNNKNSIYRAEAKKILAEDEGFKQIRLAKKKLATPEGLTKFYYNNKTWSSYNDFEFMTSQNVLKLGQLKKYNDGKRYESLEIDLSDLEILKIYRSSDKETYYLKFEGDIYRKLYKVKRNGLKFDFSQRLTANSKYYLPSISFKSEKNVNLFIEAFEKYLKKQGLGPIYINKSY